MSREAVVVGSGLGGLACAAALARAGVHVTVFEQHDEPGGFATSFTRDGFEHEVSLHVLDAVGPGEPNRALLEQLDIAHRLELLEAPSVRREIWPAEGLDLWLPPELEDLLVYLTELAPVDGPGVRALFDLASRVHARCYDAVDAGRLNLDRGSRDIHALLDRTAREVIDEHVADPRLRRLLGTLANYQGLPASRIAALPFLLMLWGYHGCSALYPKGGSRALTAALVASIEEHGGTVRCGAGVARIDARRGRVRGVELEDGTRVEARWVVSNASPLTTFSQMIQPEDVDPRYLARLRGMEVSRSFYRLYLGLDVPVDALGPCAYETFLHDQHVLGRESTLPLSMTSGSLLDPSCAPPGGGTLSITTQAPLMDEAVPRDDHRRLGDAMIEAVEDHVLPGLSAHVVQRDLAHPATFHRYSRHPGGAVLGFAAIPSQSGPRRLPGITPVANLWLAGAWVFPGAGQTASMLSGRLAAAEITRGMM